MASDRRCAREVAAAHRLLGAERCSTAWEVRLGWLVLANAATKRCGSAHNGTRFAASPDEEAVQCSRAAWGEEQMCTGSMRSLVEQLMLERVALDMHSLVQCLDEGPVTLSQDVAVAG